LSFIERGCNTTLENLIVQVDHGDLRLEESLPMMKGLRRMSLGADDYRWHSFLQNHPLAALRRNTNLEDLPDLVLDFYIDYREEIMEIKNLLVRNCNVKRALLLVQPQPDTGNLIPSSSWILRRAIAQLARDTASGASAINQMLQRRPALLDAPMRRPPAAVPPREQPVATVEQQRNCLIIDNSGIVHDNSSTIDYVNCSNNDNELQQHYHLDNNDGSSGRSSGRKRARFA
jgi:hypothetical protein